MTRQPNRPADAVEFEGEGAVKLKGWWFRGGKRGTVIVLHGVADNRGSSVGIADHFVARGFEVVAYDSRAHGESEGSACTYGFYEKEDLRRVLDRVTTKPIVLMGMSLGASVALQEAADDRRVGAIVAVSPFSDLRTAVRERAPFFASEGNISEAFKLAEQQGNFRVDDVSPMSSGGRVTAATMIIHGERDDETPVAHSHRIFAALREPKRLIVVPGAGHSHVLRAQDWSEIDGWLDTILATPRAKETAPNQAGIGRAPAQARQ
jgi:hypothetical protein